jgi:hypothetical protein
MSRFHDWCRMRGVAHLPASPIHVSHFVAETGLNADLLYAELVAIDEQHEALNYAPPCKARIVTAAFNDAHPVPPPRSWRKESEWPAFEGLPHAVKLAIVRRENDKDNVVRQAQNETALLRQELKRLKEGQNEIKTTHAA